MKVSQSMMNIFVKSLILMILFVIMFMISSFLYSARYWPDVYNYINANITIRRIPTISELKLTMLEEDITTETYYSTSNVDYVDTSTIDFLDIDEFMKDEIDFKKRVKRNIVVEQLKDYIELPPRPIFIDYIFLEEPIKQEIFGPKNKAVEEPEPVEIDEDDNIVKASDAGIFKEDEPPKPTVYEKPAVTKNYYTVQPTKSLPKRCVADEPSTTEPYIIETTKITTAENIPEHSTTKEGYLVGDDSNSKVNEVTEEPVILTTRANENELVDDEKDTRLMRDSVDVSNLSTRGLEEVEMVTRKPWKLQMMPDPVCHGDPSCQEFTKAVFPWIASIFITNSNQEESQFNYYCDGVLLSEKIILTDARCVMVGNKTLEPDSILVFLGKVNLQSFGGNEKVQKVNSIIIHPNFTVLGEGRVTNDLALIVMEDAVEFKGNMLSACIHQENSIEESATTAWGLDGALVPIFFNKEKGENCFDKDEDVFCATYGNKVALCPSYGGIFASRQADRWCLSGIFYGDPADRGICFTKDVHYTSLTKHQKWIDDIVGMFKNDVS